MTKLYTTQERQRAAAKPERIRTRRHQIAETFPTNVRPFAKGRFIIRAERAVKDWLDLLPQGVPPELHPDERVRHKYRRRHRPTAEQPNAPRGAHRPADPHRHRLIGDLYDAYMTARGSDDPDGVRGFKQTADAALTAAGLPRMAEGELRQIRAQIKEFARLAAGDLKRQH